MKLNKYKMKIGIPESMEFLVYGKDNFEIPKEIEEITLLQENLNKEELDANFDLGRLRSCVLQHSKTWKCPF